jgi:hypothetical protein
MYKVLLSAGCDPKDVVGQRLPYRMTLVGWSTQCNVFHTSKTQIFQAAASK